MKLVKRNNFLNSEIKTKTFVLPEVGSELVRLPLIMALIGSSGVGKTTTAVNLIKQYQKYRAFDDIALISPTATRNELGMRSEPKWSGIASEEYSNCDEKTLNEVLRLQKERLKMYNEYLIDKKLYEKFMRDPNNSGLTMNESNHIYNNYVLLNKKPVAPFGKERYEHCLIILDDCCSQSREKFLGDFASKSRHYNCSLIVLSQFYTQLGRGLRQQLNSIIIFKTMDAKILQSIYLEMSSGDMEYADFLDLFKLLETRKDFILINLKEIRDNLRYRRNFNEFIEF